MNLRALYMCLLLILGCSGFRCDKNARPVESAPPKPPADLRLVILTDPKGYLEPCGCQMRPLGGVDKLATVLAESQRLSTPQLVLAAGDLTFGSVLRPEDAKGAQQQELWRADTLVDIWRDLGISAVAPGPLDLSQSREVLTALVARSKFPWLADNLEGADRAGLASAQLLAAGPIKVGVLGLIAPSPALRAPEGLVVNPALAEVARKAAQSLRAQGARLVVALLSGDRRSAREIAGAGVDVVVLGGVEQEKPLTPVVTQGGIVVNAGYQGQRVLTLDLELDAQGPWHDASAWTLREQRGQQQQTVDELRRKIAAWEKDPGIKANDLDTQRARLKTLEEELAAGSVPSYAGRWFAAEITELSPDVKGSPAIASELDAYDKRVNEHNGSLDIKPLPALEGQPHYVGSEACKSCHAEEYDWWKQTKHGRAYATLESIHKNFNMSCAGCHVTGYNQPGGSTVTYVQNLKDVGCENCHGPGSSHMAAPDKPGLVARDTPEAVCVGCHNHEHSDRFKYDAFRTLLIVPGHGLPKVN